MKTPQAISDTLLNLVNQGFVSRPQACAIQSGFRGEERAFFFGKILEMSEFIRDMPKTYEQDGKGDEAVVTLHYFVGVCDWYITEKDVDRDNEGQIQAFGYATLGDGAELGYINLFEVARNGGELDLYFAPCTVGELKAKGKF